MNRYVYLSHIRKMRPWLIVICLLTAALNLWLFFQTGLQISLVAVALLVSMSILTHVMYGRLGSAEILTDTTGFTYRRGAKEIRIDYAKVTRVSARSMRHTGGFIKITTPKESVRLTVNIENGATLLYGLHKGLRAAGNVAVINEKSLLSYYQTAVFAQHSWAQLRDYKSRLMIATTLIFGVVAGVFSILLAFMNRVNDVARGLELIGMFLFGSLAMIPLIVAPLVAYLIFSLQTARELRKRTPEITLEFPGRDLTFEEKTWRSVIQIVVPIACVYAVIAALLVASM